MMPVNTHLPRGTPTDSKLYASGTHLPTTAAQTLSLRALAGKAFTIFRAGFAFTITTLPKTSRLPAFVAGFVLVFNRKRPGNMKTPVLATSFDASSARLSMTFEHTDF